MQSSDEEKWILESIFAKDRGDLTQALECCEKALEINPKSGSAWSYKGNALGLMGRLADAFYSFHRALAIDPDYTMAQTGKQQCLFAFRETGTISMAADQCYNLGISFGHMNQHDEAIHWYKCAIELDAESLHVWMALGISHMLQNHLVEAIDCCDQVIAREPVYMDAWTLKAATLSKWGKVDEAIYTYQHIIAHDSESALSWFGLGLCFYRQENYNKAIECFDRAVAIMPDYQEAWWNKANAHIKQLNAKDAADSLRQYLRLKPGDKGASLELQACELMLARGLDVNETKYADRTDEDFSVGQLVAGRFEIRSIHRGGMGIIYCVWDRQFLAILALKSFQNRFLFDPDKAKQFILEATTWLKLGRHRNIVSALWIERIGGRPYIIMEYVEGTSLRAWIGTERLSPLQILDFGIQFCTGMMYLANRQINVVHKGLLHRDIKPENILIATDNTLKITDFGLAKVFPNPTISSTNENRLKPGLTVQQTGPAGTRPYMSPEQLLPDTNLDIRSDIFSFGVVLYEMLAGKRPLHNATSDENIAGEIEYLYPGLPKGFYDITMKCLEKRPDDRYDSFSDIRVGLLSCYREITLKNYPLEKLAITDSEITEEDPLLVARGFSASRLHNYDEAIILFDQAIRIDPSNYNALNLKARTLVEKESYTEALYYFDQALTKTSDVEEKAFLYHNQSNVLIHLNRFVEAIDYCNHCLILAPQCKHKQALIAGALTNKGNALRELNQLDEALKCYDQAIEAFSQAKSTRNFDLGHMFIGDLEEEIVWWNRGFTLRLMEDLQADLQSQKRALELNPRTVWAWAEMGIIYLKLQRYRMAIQCFQKAADLNREQPRSLLRAQDRDEFYALTNDLEARGQYAESLIIYDILTLAFPKWSPYWTARGLCLGHLGDNEEAFSSLERAITLDPHDYQPRLNKAILLFEIGHYKQSLESIEEVLKLTPQHHNAQTMRQMCLNALSSGRKQTVFDKLKRFLRLSRLALLI